MDPSISNSVNSRVKISKISVLLQIALISQLSFVSTQEVLLNNIMEQQQVDATLYHNDNKFQLQQDAEPLTRDYVIEMGLLFLNGMEVEKFGSNWTNCYTRWVDFVYYEIPAIEIKYQYGDFKDQFLNTTLLIQNMSNHFMVCTDATLSFVDYVVYVSEAFGSIGNWATGLLENFLNNVMGFYYVIEDIIQAQESGNQTGVIYSSARIVYLIFDFEADTLTSQNLANLNTDGASTLLEDEHDFSSFRQLTGASKEHLKLQTSFSSPVYGGDVLLTLEGSTEFFYGFMAGTLGTTYDSLDECVSQIEDGWVYHAEQMSNDIDNGISDDAALQFWDIIWYLHPVMEKCIDSTVDYGALFWDLIQLYLNPKQLVQNIIWYFAAMYDSWEDMAEFFETQTVGDDAYQEAYDAGWALGYPIYLIFKPADE